MDAAAREERKTAKPGIVLTHVGADGDDDERGDDDDDDYVRGECGDDKELVARG